MKKATLIIIIAAALSACSSTRNQLPERTDYDLSWSLFCEANGYDVADRDNSQACDEYLDTWRGSAQEEETLLKSNVEPL